MVAGAGYSTPTNLTPVIWSRDATGAWSALRLGFPGTDNFGWATDVSEPDASGRVYVSGHTETAGRHLNASHAVRWTLQGDAQGRWQVISIESLLPIGQSGAYPGNFGISANNSGDVVGMSNGTIDQSTPVIWPADGGVTALPMPPTASGSGRVLDVNNLGWIVGSVFDKATSCDRAVIWRQGAAPP